MPEAPKEDDQGHLIGYFDILDTPCGKIAYQLAKYGFQLGISSRGTGDLITDDDGNEAVDPDTYDFTCFDLVIVPAVESARLTMQEGLSKEKNEFKVALTESLNSASESDRKIMEEALNELNITVGDNVNIDSTPNSKTSKKLNEANNDGSLEMIRSLQESLKERTRLESELQSLQEQLAVSNAKVGSISEELERYKSTTIRLSEMAQKSKSLTEKISNLENDVSTKDELIERLRKRSSKLIEEKNKESINSNTLSEELFNKDNELKSLKEDFNKMKSNYEDKIKSLNEELTKRQNEFNTNVNNLNEQITNANQRAKKYKKLSESIVEKYIVTKATMLGINAKEIKNKLDSTYTLEDVDRICEELQSYELNVSRLPFSFDKNTRVKVTESKNEGLKPRSQDTVRDDDVDESLIRMAGLN